MIVHVSPMAPMARNHNVLVCCWVSLAKNAIAKRLDTLWAMATECTSPC